ncbi:MAG: hypothetical protein K0S07_1119 [Chlamydiales bacterium]|nr:hypothetical protein [Chlamydiales bacterium]
MSLKIAQPSSYQSANFKAAYQLVKKGGCCFIRKVDSALFYAVRLIFHIYLANVCRRHVLEPVGKGLNFSVQWILKKGGFPHLVAKALGWSAQELASPYVTEMIAQQAGYIGSLLIVKGLSYVSFSWEEKPIDPYWQLVDYDAETSTLSSVPINLDQVQTLVLSPISEEE